MTEVVWCHSRYKFVQWLCSCSPRYDIPPFRTVPVSSKIIAHHDGRVWFEIFCVYACRELAPSDIYTRTSGREKRELDSVVCFILVSGSDEGTEEGIWVMKWRK